MRETGKNRAEDGLRRLLRQGDPAADSDGIPAPSLARMRARVVDAAADRRRPALGAFVWATAAAVGLLVLVAIALRPEAPPATESTQSPSAPTPAGTAGPERAEPAPPPAGIARAERAAPIPPAASRSHEGRRRRPGTIAAAAPIGSSPGVAVDAAPRRDVPDAAASKRMPLTVQFTTPAGTRIFWTLDPEFKG